MIELQSYIVKECCIINFDARILNFHQILTGSIVDKEGVSNILNGVFTIFNVHS
jgi:hypothetical protein